MADWDVESGLVDKFDGTVEDAYFEEGQYGVTLKLLVSSPQLDQDNELWFSCGQKGVEFVDDGHVDVSLAKNGRFNEQSGVGILIKSLKAHPDLLAQIASKGGPDEAATFKGFTARWERTQFGEKQDGTPRYVTVPTGAAGGVKAEAKVEEVTEIPKWLADICIANDTYDSFVEAALADERIDRASRKLVMDETLWDF